MARHALADIERLICSDRASVWDYYVDERERARAQDRDESDEASLFVLSEDIRRSGNLHADWSRYVREEITHELRPVVKSYERAKAGRGRTDRLLRATA